MITTHEVAASVQIDLDTTVDLDVKSGRITMDDGWSPYIQAELVCALPTESDLELLDPRENLRATVTATKTFDPFNNGTFTDQSRTFDLLLRSRRVDHAAAEMTVTLESDEALLNDYALVATSPERIYGLSVKDAVVYALDKIGAALAPGAADADIESDVMPDDVVSLIENPSIELNTTGWSNAGRTTSFARSSAFASDRAYCLSFALSTGTYGTAYANSSISASADEQYSFKFQIRSTVARTFNASLLFYNSANTLIAAIDGPTVTSSTTAWTTAAVSATAPAGTASIRPVINVLTGATSDTYYVDSAILTKTAGVEDYFDGATADTDFIEYSWSGSADASTSTRHYLPNSDAMIWQPGVTAWDWLEPLLATVGFHLYCNEDRDWILEASGAAKSGLVTISSGFNVTDAKDSIDREGEWFDGVVIAYTESVDSAGNTITKFDTAGTSPTKVKTIEFARPYPGAGAAQAVLDRATGRGRVLELEAITDLLAAPGMTVSASLPDTPIQVGSVSSVAWSWPEDRMRIGSRGLTDTSPSAWILDEAGVAWSDLATGVDWTEDV